MKRIDIDNNYEKIVSIPKIGNVKILFWFYGCPRLDVKKILSNNKQINFAVDYHKLAIFFNTLIVKEEWNGFCVGDDSVNKIAEYLPKILIKHTKAKRNEDLMQKIERHKEITHKLEDKKTVLRNAMSAYIDNLIQWLAQNPDHSYPEYLKFKRNLIENVLEKL